MIKQAPSLLRIASMVIFALSCFGILVFLWISFGGPTPIKPEGYRVKVHFPEAATLAVESDVRLAGVNVGKVKKKELDKGGARTIVELELKTEYAPIAKDTKAILRQKTLFGETYVGLSSGHKSSGILKDGATLPSSQVEPTVELDEIFTSFDEPTRRAFQEWMRELAKASRGESSEHLNDAFGNLEGFAVDGAKLLGVLDEQEVAVRRLIKNTGVVFGAINERQGALRGLIQNSHNTFEATASRDEALAETFHIFPTFLDESRVTMARLERFARDTRPLVRDLKAPADDLGPTVRDLGDLAPHLTRLFRDLGPLIRASRTGVPDLERVLNEAEPVFEALNSWFDQMNPILSMLGFNRSTVAAFLTQAAPALAGAEPFGTLIPRNHYLPQIAAVDGRSFQRFERLPPYDRGNAYIAPNAYVRQAQLGAVEVFGSCAHTGQHEVRDPDPAEGEGDHAAPPCFVQPPSLLNGEQFPLLNEGEAPRRVGPLNREGTEPAVP
jgi:phospholipid/cholesterol/gamma-HCH transport system substrate-binding protein